MRAQGEDDYDWWFRAAYPSIARTAFLIVHDRTLAEEIAQEAFLQLHRHWSKVHDYERPDLWVRRVAIRLAVRNVKRDQRRRSLERMTVPLSVPHEELPDPDLLRAVAGLSPMQRAAVVLHYWADESVFDIARTLGVSESSIKQHLFRARARLATALGEEVGGDVG